MIARRTVGPHQWLIVGALLQSPSSRLPIEILYQHMSPWLFPGEVRSAMAPLIRDGVIEAGAYGKVLTLTDKGEEVRRKPSKSSVPYFWALVVPPGVELP
jgi:hypothetical protein